jgi:plasmid stabilization system protein ParE
MAVVIKWADEAKITFDKNINYLQEEWTDKEIRNFMKQTNNILSRITAYPEMYSQSAKNPKVRKASINKYIVLYYRYYSSKKEVILLTFWHNKQDPKRLKY